MSDYLPIVEPLLIRRRRGEPFRTAHAWREGSRYVACGKRVGGVGWMVNPVPWTIEPSSECVRCPDCIVAVEGGRVGRRR
jgi:hypothetical protein